MKLIIIDTDSPGFNGFKNTIERISWLAPKNVAIPGALKSTLRSLISPSIKFKRPDKSSLIVTWYNGDLPLFVTVIVKEFLSPPWTVFCSNSLSTFIPGLTIGA